MPFLTIDKLNYVVTGKSETFINLNYSYDKNKNEITQWADLPNYLRDKNNHLYIWENKNKTLFIDEDMNLADKTQDQITKKTTVNGYNTHRLYKSSGSSMLKFNKENETGHLERDDKIFALFDTFDIAVQSPTGKGIMRHEDGVNVISSDSMLDIYSPLFDKNILGVYQWSDNQALAVTPATTYAPVYKYTTLIENREERLDGKSRSLMWNMKFKSEVLPGITHIPLSDLYKNHPLSAENIEQFRLKKATDSYFDYISSYEELSAHVISNLVLDNFNFKGVEQNYLISYSINSSVPNSFNDGVIPGEVIIGKTFYDAEYCSNRSTNNKYKSTNNSVAYLTKTRDYIDAKACGGKIFLKFYDFKNYATTKSIPNVEPHSDCIDLPVNLSSKYKNKEIPVPYQKIEVLDSINKFRNSGTHKTNLYSVKIHDLNLENAVEQFVNTIEPDVNKRIEETANYLTKIKANIENDIRRIARALTPAHVELFDVKYL